MREPNNPGGRLLITLRDPVTRRVVLERRVKNLVTLAGRTLLAELLIGAVAGIAEIELVVGGPPDDDTSTPPPALTDTTLERQLKAVPVTAEPIPPQPGDQRMVTRISGTLEAVIGDDTLIMTEAGIKFTKIDDNEEVLYNRVTFDRITKEPNLEMTLTWEVIF